MKRDKSYAHDLDMPYTQCCHPCFLSQCPTRWFTLHAALFAFSRIPYCDGSSCVHGNHVQHAALRWSALHAWESSPKTHRSEKMQRAANVMKIKGGEGAHVFMRWETFKTYRTELRSGSCRSLSGGFDAPPSIGVGTNF